MKKLLFILIFGAVFLGANAQTNFIKTNKHLPNVAPAAVMETKGINLSEMNAMLI